MITFYFFFLRFTYSLEREQGEGQNERGKKELGIPGWRSGLVPAFVLGRDPGDPGSNPTSGSWCMEPASPSAYVSASLCVSFVNK